MRDLELSLSVRQDTFSMPYVSPAAPWAVYSHVAET